jgi:hypothetical protein
VNEELKTLELPSVVVNDQFPNRLLIMMPVVVLYSVLTIAPFRFTSPEDMEEVVEVETPHEVLLVLVVSPLLFVCDWIEKLLLLSQLTLLLLLLLFVLDCICSSILDCKLFWNWSNESPRLGDALALLRN